MFPHQFSGLQEKTPIRQLGTWMEIPDTYQDIHIHVYTFMYMYISELSHDGW